MSVTLHILADTCGPVHPDHGAEDCERWLEAVGRGQSKYQSDSGVVRGDWGHVVQHLGTDWLQTMNGQAPLIRG